LGQTERTYIENVKNKVVKARCYNGAHLLGDGLYAASPHKYASVRALQSSLYARSAPCKSDRYSTIWNERSKRANMRMKNFTARLCRDTAWLKV
jgi:ribosomal protein L33